MADLETIVAYLLGEGELDGKWFGDPDVPLVAGKYKARYWWRTHLREAWNNRHGAGDAEAWRAIESAPDDGTPFLAYLPKERRTIQVGWQNKNGVMAIGSSFSFDLTPATHWRPLPAPPNDDAARAGERG